MFFRQLAGIISKEFTQDFRQKSFIAGILLYVVATVYICYLSFRSIIHPPTWNALLWIILVFAGINAVSKSFIGESRHRQLYYYYLCEPGVFLAGKLIYSILLMLFLSFLTYFFYGIFINNLVQDKVMFAVILGLGSVGLASVLTMVSAIASRTGGSFGIMAILSFPLLIPLLLLVIRLGKNAVDGLDRSLSLPYIGVTSLLILIIITLSLVLFPYLWRE
jgi:heme exporter protein B